MLWISTIWFLPLEECYHGVVVGVKGAMVALQPKPAPNKVQLQFDFSFTVYDVRLLNWTFTFVAHLAISSQQHS